MLAKIGLFIIFSILIHSWTSVWRYGKDREIEIEVGMFLDKFLGRERKWSDEYAVVTNLWNSDPEGTYEDVTLATQCSVNNLYHLPELSARWKGPMSVAIFAPRADAARAIICTYWLRLCFPSTFSRTQFHLVYPMEQAPRPDDDLLSFMESEQPVIMDTKDPSYCTFAIETMRNLKGDNYVLMGIQYPHNTLRNIALHSVQTKFALILDVDTFPAIKIRDEFLRFARSPAFQSGYGNAKAAFVVPAFEVKNGVRIPTIKSELIREYKKGNIRPFHSETCSNCHEPTGFAEWLSIPPTAELTVAYEVEWKESWEPFYVTEASVPSYDERFKQYGFDRISQVCELFVAGVRFFVLNNAFVAHDGFKYPHEFHSTKNLENRRNYKLYTEEFIPGLVEKYPNSSRGCSDGGKRKGRAQLKFRPHLKISYSRKRARDKVARLSERQFAYESSTSTRVTAVPETSATAKRAYPESWDNRSPSTAG